MVKFFFANLLKKETREDRRVEELEKAKAELFELKLDLERVTHAINMRKDRVERLENETP